MLPAETIDFIFSFLQKYPAVLKSCSAAHPLLSSLAERHRFVHIIVHLGSHPAPIDGFLVPEFARCLSERPYLADQIRTITIDASSFSYDFASSGIFDTLSTLLPSITHSEELSLRSVRWPKLSRNLRLALLNFLQKVHMKGLCLQYSDDFPLLALVTNNIKNLKINSSRCNFDHDNEYPILAHEPLSLESLSLVDINLLQYSIWAGPKSNTLVSLHAKLYPPADLSPIFTACAGSLTSLSLEIGTHYRTIYRRGIRSSVFGPLNRLPFNLSLLPSLELLTVYTAISAVVDGEIPNTSSCASALLAVTQLAATADPSLQRAVLNLDCSVGVVLDLRDAVEWGALVQLCDLPIQLRVDLCISITTISGVQPPFVEVVDSLLGNEDVSKLVERGSVIIKPFPSLD